jgi:hypothetical protein
MDGSSPSSEIAAPVRFTLLRTVLLGFALAIVLGTMTWTLLSYEGKWVGEAIVHPPNVVFVWLLSPSLVVFVWSLALPSTRAAWAVRGLVGLAHFAMYRNEFGGSGGDVGGLHGAAAPGVDWALIFFVALFAAVAGLGWLSFQQTGIRRIGLLLGTALVPLHVMNAFEIWLETSTPATSYLILGGYYLAAGCILWPESRDRASLLSAASGKD